MHVMPGVKKVDLTYEEYRESAKTADVALYTPTSYSGRAIARHTGGPGYNFCHIDGIVKWVEVDRLMACGYQEGIGGTCRPFSKLVKPGNTHIFRYEELDENLLKCVSRKYAQTTGEPYKWRNIVTLFLTLSTIGRLVVPNSLMQKWILSASNSQGSGICSQHIARAWQGCNRPLLHKPLSLITPNDISQSPLLNYVGTIS